MQEVLQRLDVGIHLKTAGTTWLEEIIGLAASGGEGLQIVKEIYVKALQRYEELCQPYLPVIDIDRSLLPDRKIVYEWSSTEFVEALRHDQTCAGYNRHFRQFIHVSFRIAAEMGGRFTRMLHECRDVIEANVTANIFDRHILPLFVDSKKIARANPRLAGRPAE
jgi:hypothetical protein